jgi:hypothetical protein
VRGEVYEVCDAYETAWGLGDRPVAVKPESVNVNVNMDVKDVVR